MKINLLTILDNNHTNRNIYKMLMDFLIIKYSINQFKNLFMNILMWIQVILFFVAHEDFFISWILITIIKDITSIIMEGNQCQKLVIKALDEYTDRHNSNFSEVGAKDLMTLSESNPRGFFQAFNTSLETGLTSQNAEINGKKFGKNIYKKRKRITFCEIFKDAICDEMLIILMIAAVVSVVVEYFAGLDKEMFWVEGVSILFAVIICSMVATYSNYEKEQQFAELDQMTEATYNYEAFRDGKRVTIHRSEIVPGDILLVSNGLQIPADCILYKAINVVIDESSITGESNQVEKNNFQISMEQRMNPDGATPFMVSGSNVVSGEGLMMAVVVGKDSRAGKNYQLIFSQNDDEQVETPLQRKLEKIANQIGYFGLISAILVFLILFIRLIFEDFQKGSFNFSQNLGKIINFIIIGVSIIVVAIPEGLPLAVTLTLAYSMKAMHEDKILVRELQSCETMGAATYICSDKTGTITQNKMNVKQVLNQGTVPIEQFTRDNLDRTYLELLTNGIFHNSSAIVDSEKGPQTQIALLKMMRNLSGRNQEIVRKQYGKSYFKRLPFDSNRKRMTTGFQLNNKDLLFMSGASQQLLQNCSYIQSSKSGQVQPINSQTKNQIFQQISRMANQGLRTIAIAYKVVNRRNIYADSSPVKRKVLEDVEISDFILLGVFGIEDPPRVQSKESIRECQNAGIHVIMVTGDNKITASNIAKQVGIINQRGGRVIEASQFINHLESKGILKQKKQDQQQLRSQKSGKSSKSSNSSVSKKKQYSGARHMKRVYFQNDGDREVFQQAIKDLAVMARSKPEHKFILVDGINKLGHVVGVTGDGANDAPALMRADIGLAMGMTGTQIAKNASDIILLDDNFKSIVRAVVWGRNVYDSIRKFLQFQLTVNVIALGLIILSAAIIKQSVFAAVQMLWVNLIMDSLAALALATQPPNQKQLLSQRPNSNDQQFITKTMMKHIIGQAIFQTFILCIILFLGHKFIPEYQDSFDGIIGSDLQAKYNNGIAQGTVADGKLYNIDGTESYKVWFDKYHNYSRHLTFLFNTFVFLQVFNFLCCRRIRDQLNMFSGICSSKIFWLIVVVIVVLQVLLTTFGGRFFQVYRYGGLTLIQWLISVGIGSLVLPISFFLRLLPIAKPPLVDNQTHFTNDEELFDISRVSPQHISVVK